MSSKDPLRPVVIAGPSGVGKGTLIAMLMERFPNDQFGFSVSHTTRPPRPGEQDGVHYNFTTVEQIRIDIAEGKFIEYAEVHGKYYGTSFAAVESVQKMGKICILDIDVQGVEKVKASGTLDPLYIFIAPPSFADLESRLRGRGTESEDAIQTRLTNAQTELDYGQTTGNFDRVFVNANLQQCFDDMALQFQLWYPHLVAMVPDDNDDPKAKSFFSEIRISLFKTHYGLANKMPGILSLLEDLAKEDDNFFILFNSGLHDISEMCTSAGAINRISALNTTLEEYSCVQDYRQLLTEFANGIAKFPAFLRVWETTTAAWPKWGNYGAAWPPNRPQGLPESTNMVHRINDIAYEIMVGRNISVLDAYWLTLPRPDHREADGKNQLGPRLAHTGPEVYDVLMRKFAMLVLEAMKGNIPL